MTILRPIVLAFIFCSIFPEFSEAQNLFTEVRGVVIDATTKEPLPYVDIRFPHTFTNPSQSDPKGVFHIKSIEKNADSISFSFTGYRTRTVPIKHGQLNEVNITMGSEALPLTEVVVKPKGKKFKHIIDTAALFVFHKVVENKSKNRVEGINSYKYDYYDKLQIALLNPSQKLVNFFLFKPFKFVFNNIDTTEDGDIFIPGILKEAIGTVYYRHHPRATKKYIWADQISGIDNPSIGNLANYQFAEINPYDDLFIIANTTFTAPFAPAANVVYNYYMMDTSKINGRTTFHLAFTGKVKEDLLVQGYVWIDSATWAIQSIKFKPNGKSNINFLTDYTVQQKYVLVSNKYWLMKREELHTVGSMFKKKHETSLMITKVHDCRNIEGDIEFPEDIFKGPDQVVLDDSARNRSLSYWDSARFEPLTKQEKEVYHIADTIKLLRIWKTYQSGARFLTAAFLDAGPISIGRILNFVSRNNVEGWRLRFGFETNPRFQHAGTPANNFFRKFYFSTYGAYGLTDHIFQYQFLTRFNLPRKNDHYQALEALYRFDMVVPGQDESQSVLTFDNVFTLLSGSTTTFSEIMRVREFKVDYEKEWWKGFSTAFTARQQTYYEVDSVLRFVRDVEGAQVQVPQFNITQFVFDARYSYNDQYFVSNFYRFFLTTKYPVFSFRYTAGIVNMQNNYFTYHNLQFSIRWRSPSPLGHTVYLFRAGKILGDAPFTAWYLTQGNLGYLLDRFNYNLLNQFEFATDQYVSLWIEHHFDGFFLNRIPLVNKLRLRELVYAKALLGSLSQRNVNVLEPPPGLSSPEPIPYIEAGFGIENIAKLFRVDFVWRVTYRNVPFAPNWGVKFAIAPGF